MDRKSLIGFFLLLVMAGVYLFFNNRDQQKYQAERQKIVADSLAHAKVLAQNAVKQQVQQPVDSSLIGTAFVGNEQKIPLDNGKIKITFSTKGGQPIIGQVDSFKTYSQQPLIFFDGTQGNRFAIKVPYKGKDVWTDSLYFTPKLSQANNGAQVVEMTANLEAGKSIILSYTIYKESYMIDASIRLVGMQQELSGLQSLPINWKTAALHTERDMKGERMYSQIHYRFGESNKHDYESAAKEKSKTFETALNWMSVRTHFFNSTILAGPQNFVQGSTFTVTNDGSDSSNIVMSNNATLMMPLQVSNDYKFDYKWLISPNDYKMLKSYNADLQEIIPLGQGLFSFVKYISKWLVVPLFDWLSGFNLNFGVIIIIMTLIIRLFLSFFTYKSYLSSAKMRVLKPEIDKMKEKFGNDQQKVGVEQMKLYRSAGVNPLGGCLPLLVQMPFLLSIYYFFPTAIQLRQSKFLWSNDLSTYDSIASWTTNIPLLSSVYGNHISLFTLLMTASSLLLALYNKQMTAGQEMNNPTMKYMPYIMPIIFLGWFNSMAAGLTFYYFFTNMISLLQQFIIQKFVINEDKIHQKMQEQKNKPASLSKWQQKLEELQKMQEQKNK